MSQFTNAVKQLVSSDAANFTFADAASHWASLVAFRGPHDPELSDVTKLATEDERDVLRRRYRNKTSQLNVLLSD